jgi:hypothetical protein
MLRVSVMYDNLIYLHLNYAIHISQSYEALYGVGYCIICQTLV